MHLHRFFGFARAWATAAAIAGAIGLAPLPAFAQSQETAQLVVRIQQLEEQIRLLTGQVEGLQFQMAQMQTLLERMTEDNEFRFQQLEGNAGATLPVRPDEPQTASVAPPTTTTEAAPSGTVPQLAPLDLSGGDSLGESADPLVGSNGTGSATLGSLDGGRPLDLTLDGGVELVDGDATAQYEAGYDAIVRGDYAFAEDQFQQFIALYPNDANAPDATNWLGEALIQRGAYDDAALVLAEGYQKYQGSSRAPDLMLKLGIALVGAGEIEVACRTFFTLQKRYPDLPPAFTQRLASEKSRAQCPV